MKKVLSIVLSLVMLTVLLVGCSDSSQRETQTTAALTETKEEATSPIVTQGADEQTEAESAEVKFDSVHREVINVGIEADVTTWAPWDSGSSGRNDALFGIYQGLVDFDPLKGQFNGVLCKNFEMDQTSLKCELWDNIVDSEGHQIKASDVEYSLAEAAKIATDLQDIVMNIEDDYNFTFTFVEDDGSPRDIEVGELKRFCFFIVSEEAATGGDLASKPVGTGPYVLESQTSGYMFTFQANKDYWAAEDQITHIRDRQNVDTINWYVIPESAQRATALSTGTIDICAYISNEDLAKFDGQGFHLYEYPHNLSMIMWANADEVSPCNDENLRKAIYYAVSQEAVLQSVYGGRGTVLYDQCPNWQVGYNPAWETEDNYYQFSIEKAQEYLGKSSYNNEELTIISNTNGPCVSTAQIVENFLGQIGIRCKVASYESSVYSEYIQDPKNWDIMVNTRPASAGFLANGWESDMAAYRQPWGGTINFIYDDDFQAQLATLLKVETSTQENFDKTHDYMVEHAFSKGLVNYNSVIVVPDCISEVALSYRKTIMPGGCTYSE